MSDDGRNPWMGRRVIAWGHQGGDEGHRPNTIAALRAALDGGAHALEFDVHLTADDPTPRLVLNHDPTIRLPHGSEIEIETSTVDQLRAERLDIATLDEVLGEFHDVPLTIEIKASPAATPTADMVADSSGVGPVILTGFSGASVKAIKEAQPGLDTAPASGAVIWFWFLSLLRLQRMAGRLARDHVALQVPFRLDQVDVLRRIPGIRRLRVSTTRFISAARQIGLAVHVWTLDEEADMLDAVRFGADGIMTNKPTLLAQVLNRQGVSWSGE